MGQTTSKVVKKVATPVNYMMGWYAEDDPGRLPVAKLGNPFIHKRRGSMYFDEDGDLAHEFYEEVPVPRTGGRRTKMKRRKDNLTPQGEIDLPFPRLNVDLPIVLCEALR